MEIKKFPEQFGVFETSSETFRITGGNFMRNDVFITSEWVFLSDKVLYYISFLFQVYFKRKQCRVKFSLPEKL